MRLTDRVYLVGSGANGLFLSHRSDCTVYAVDCDGPIALVDAGVGGEGTDLILRHLRGDGLDPEAVTHLLVTHKHADHSGGAADFYERLGVQVVATSHTAEALRRGDEEMISMGAAKRAGLYDPDYVFRACPVDRVLEDGEALTVGDVTFELLETPGHCAGHCAFTFRRDGKLHLFGGDNVFAGGKILLQNIPDCDLQAHLETVRRLAALDVEVFLPGHTMPALREGYRHLQAALARMDRLLVPESYH
ncbi:MAG: MBL fold metallo-hydrolase [Anaerolineae bacterium]|nr:MBL fold metallo-hydrolase [Anaerolineae bacterium]